MVECLITKRLIYMDNSISHKPIVVICLDDPLANQIREALPQDHYDIQMAQNQ